MALSHVAQFNTSVNYTSVTPHAIRPRLVSTEHQLYSMEQSVLRTSAWEETCRLLWNQVLTTVGVQISRLPRHPGYKNVYGGV